ncbi:hypothetical protein KQI84_05645 [bacterium]|nr:hypothetical protein [bacterium]
MIGTMNRVMTWPFRRFARSRRRGFSFIEMLVASTAFTAVGIFVAYVSIAIAKQARQSLTVIPAQGRAYRAADRVRNHLLAASFGSVTVTDLTADGWGRTITFMDPSKATGTNSSIYFDANNGRLYYADPGKLVDGSVVGNQTRTWDDVVDAEFRVIGSGKFIQVKITDTGRDLRNNPVELTYMDTLTVRN